MNPNRIALVVAVFSGTAVLGPMVGVSPAWITVAVISALVMVSVDAAAWNGRGGHLLAEALPGGQERLRRIALHEAGHRLLASHEDMELGDTLVGSLACLRAGHDACGRTTLSWQVWPLSRWCMAAAMAAWMIASFWAASGGSRVKALRPPSLSNAAPGVKWSSGSSRTVRPWIRSVKAC
jgi:hypothetical protein